MSTTEFSTQRDELLAERDHLLTQLGHMGRAPGTSELEFDEGFADSGQVTAERGEVDALAKLENGTYGQCEDCGSTIAAPRLEAVPAARYCITCASKQH